MRKFIFQHGLLYFRTKKKRLKKFILMRKFIFNTVSVLSHQEKTIKKIYFDEKIYFQNGFCTFAPRKNDLKNSFWLENLFFNTVSVLSHQEKRFKKFILMNVIIFTSKRTFKIISLSFNQNKMLIKLCQKNNTYPFFSIESQYRAKSSDDFFEVLAALVMAFSFTKL